MDDQNSPSDELIERDEEAPPVITYRMRRSSFNATDDNAQKIRRAWPNSASLLRWALIERLNSRSRDPLAAAEKLWRKREKRIRRAQLQSNKEAPADLAKD